MTPLRQYKSNTKCGYKKEQLKKAQGNLVVSLNRAVQRTANAAQLDIEKPHYKVNKAFKKNILSKGKKQKHAFFFLLNMWTFRASPQKKNDVVCSSPLRNN